MTKIVVSFTTIPPRQAFLAEMLESIRSQTRKPDSIELNLPKSYKRADLGQIDADLLPEGCDIHWIDEDYGPATKVLPTVERYAGEDVWIVYCDDDRVYDPNWLERLTDAARAHPGAVICDRARSSLKWENRDKWGARGPLYRLLRLASLSLWHPLAPRGYVPDIAEGCGGVLIRPDFVDEQAYDIPDILWTVDDVWLSGMYERVGCPVRETGIDWALTEHYANQNGVLARDVAALHKFETEGHGRMAANLACIRYMRDRFAVFSGRRRR